MSLKQILIGLGIALALLIVIVLVIGHWSPGEQQNVAKTMSVDLTPSLGKQKEALDRLAEAIRILQPPEPQDGDQDKNQDQVSREQAERELQQAREREAARERDRRPRAPRKPPEPVDKDW